MDKTLFLAEKPSVGKDLARVLKCSRKGNGCLEGDKHIVTWALGHLVTLADPENYDQKFSAWRMEDLPILPPRLKLSVIKQTGKQYNAVTTQMKRSDVKEIVIATDAGREGELVARWILEKAQIKKPLKRLWISSVTDKAILEGVRNLKNGKDYENLYASAVARAEADWLVGINATRALTCKHNAPLSCGRVQTPTLAIIAKREAEIQSFKPQTYYGITAQSDKLTLVWQDKQTKDARIFDQAKSTRIVASLHHKNAVVTAIDKTRKKTYAPKLYDLTELQRDANRLFNYSPKDTLSIMQNLYEQYKLLTYPRTDSCYITTDMVDTIKERLKACSVSAYAKLTAKILKGTIKADKSFVDNSKVTDHHAIIPTEQPVFLNKLSDPELKIYDLVVKRFIAILYPPFEYEQTIIRADIGGELFTARGKIVLSPGWKEVYNNTYRTSEEDEEEGGGKISEQILPPLNKGDVLKIQSINETSGQTTPPAPFNEATLLSAMENPAKYMVEESKSLIQTIGKTGGLGTVATRADIIEKLFNNFLIEHKERNGKEGKNIYLTSKGRQLLDLVPGDLKRPALTAQWEQKLEAIAQGSLNKTAFISDIKNYAGIAVNDIKNSLGKFKYDNLSGEKCPNCGKYLLEINGKKGQMLICQDRECGYRKEVSRTTNARCPNCHKKLSLKGDGQIFVCSCGYREKLSAFQQRRGKEAPDASKSDVQQYLRRQNKDQDQLTNTALADALAKW